MKNYNNKFRIKVNKQNIRVKKTLGSQCQILLDKKYQIKSKKSKVLKSTSENNRILQIDMCQNIKYRNNQLNASNTEKKYMKKLYKI